MPHFVTAIVGRSPPFDSDATIMIHFGASRDQKGCLMVDALAHRFPESEALLLLRNVDLTEPILLSHFSKRG